MKISAISVVLAVALFFCVLPAAADTYSIAGDTGDVAFTSGGVDYDHASIGLQDTDDVNGLSAGDDPIPSLYTSPFPYLMFFSVDPVSQGVSGTCVNDRYNAPSHDEEEWLYGSEHHPPPPPPDGWNDDNDCEDHVTPGEDLDGYDFTTLGTTPGMKDRIYFTVASGGSIDDDVIWTCLIDSPGTLAVYASADDLGLQAGDDLDAISVYDKDGDGVYDGEDLILFSLTASSPNAASGATIYAPGLDGDLPIVAYPVNIGLLNSDDANALEGRDSAPEPSTIVLMGTALLGLMAARRRWKS